MRTFLGFMKAAATGVGVSVLIGALFGVFFGDFSMWGLGGALISIPGIIFGGLVYRGFRLRSGDRAGRIIPALVSGVLAGTLAAALTWRYFVLESASHPTDEVSGAFSALVAIYITMAITVVIAVFAAIFGAGVGQR